MDTPVTLAERLRCWAAALSCWIVAGCFLVAWWWPLELDGGRWARFGVGIMVAEFVVVHAGAMTAELARGGATYRRAMLALFALYLPFFAAIPWIFGSWSLAGVFAMLVAGRLLTTFRPTGPREMAAVRRRAVVSALLWLLSAGASVALPLPAGGIDAALLDAVWPDRGTGAWEQEPQRALAMGLAYFALLGWVESRPPAAVWHKPLWTK